VNNLPRVVARIMPRSESNPRPLDHESTPYRYTTESPFCVLCKCVEQEPAVEYIVHSWQNIQMSGWWRSCAQAYMDTQTHTGRYGQRHSSRALTTHHCVAANLMQLVASHESLPCRTSRQLRPHATTAEIPRDATRPRGTDRTGCDAGERRRDIWRTIAAPSEKPNTNENNRFVGRWRLLIRVSISHAACQ